jgi:hypothetical protein
MRGDFVKQSTVPRMTDNLTLKFAHDAVAGISLR